MIHEHLTPTEAIAYSVNKTMAENTGENGQPQEINSRADADQFAAVAKEAQEKSLNQIRESLKSQGWSDEVADRIVRGLAQEEARVDEETGQPPPAAGWMRGAGSGKGGEPPEEPPEAPAAIPPEEPEEPEPIIHLGPEIMDIEVRRWGHEFNQVLEAAGATQDRLLDMLNDLSRRPTRNDEQEAQKKLLEQGIIEAIRRISIQEQQAAERERPGRRQRGGYEQFFLPDGQLKPDLTLDEVRDAIDQAPDAGSSRFPPELMQAALRFPELRERLINRILFKPYEDTTEANRYDINFYAKDNLETLLSFLSYEDVNKYSYFVKLSTAADLFHSMNVTLVGGKLEEFIRVAANINYEHFSLMQQLRGVSEVMRLYEEKYQEILAKNKRIATEGYKQLKAEVEKSFRALNEVGVVRSEYEGARTGDNPERMQDWEVTRALNVGRTFFNITFRAAEHIANGQLEEGGRRWTGFPQEDAVRLMNWPKWLIQRFGVATPRGGLEFLKRTNRNYFEFLNSRGRRLGINRITELGGMNVRELEEGGMFGVSGVYSSWRLETMLFQKILIVIDGQETTLNDWMATHKEEIEEIKKSRASLPEKQQQLLNIFTPLIDNSSLGLGILLKYSLSEGEFYEVRKKLWERVSDTNLPLMISYLSSIQLQGEDQSQNLIRPVDWNDEQWDEFKKRILLDHAWKMKRVANSMIPEDQRTILSDQSPLMLSNPENYTRAQEEALIKRIKSEGRALAGNLADIVFPYVPFMNDVPFELIDYAGPGETFYKRRSGSDLPSFSAAERAFTTIVNNPGGIGAENALKAFDEIVKGIEQPQGTKDAQERVFPMFSAWGEFVMARPGQRQMILKAVTEMLRRPTSIAQEFAGMEAESLTESDVLNILGNATKAGILSHDLYNEMKKKKHLGLIWLLWALVRDLGFIIPLIPVWQLGKEVVK